jgi:hypothetical protein
MTTRLDVLNRIAGAIGARTYLEIGVQAGQVFRLVNVAHRVGVDPDPTSAATVKQTSDDYFASLEPDAKFDLIFVDGLHLREQVLQDAGNALAHVSDHGVIVFHDCDPPDERAGQREPCAGFWCGDTWRAWLDIRAMLPRRTFTVDADLGLGVIAPVGLPSDVLTDLLSAPATASGSISWSEFQAQRPALLRLMSPDVFRTWIRTLAGARPRG